MVVGARCFVCATLRRFWCNCNHSTTTTTTTTTAAGLMLPPARGEPPSGGWNAFLRSEKWLLSRSAAPAEHRGAPSGSPPCRSSGPLGSPPRSVAAWSGALSAGGLGKRPSPQFGGARRAVCGRQRAGAAEVHAARQSAAAAAPPVQLIPSAPARPAGGHSVAGAEALAQQARHWRAMVEQHEQHALQLEQVAAWWRTISG